MESGRVFFLLLGLIIFSAAEGLDYEEDNTKDGLKEIKSLLGKLLDTSEKNAGRLEAIEKRLQQLEQRDSFEIETETQLTKKTTTDFYTFRQEIEENHQTVMAAIEDLEILVLKTGNLSPDNLSSSVVDLLNRTLEHKITGNTDFLEALKNKTFPTSQAFHSQVEKLFKCAEFKKKIELKTLPNGTFHFHTQWMEWKNASDFCLKHGMQLASFSTLEEMQQVAQAAPELAGFWVSAKDMGHSPGQFLWADGTRVAEILWHKESNEPNDSVKGKETCVLLSSRVGKLLDTPCNNGFSFVCQFSQDNSICL